jgi:endonuclease YncB( thermonuclease family)
MACRHGANWSERLLHKPVRLAIFIFFLLLVLPDPAAHAGTFSVLGQSRWVEVGRILDGDTFVSRSGEHVRLLGINAPEVAHENSPAQVMGDTATRALARLISGQTVHLEFDVQHKDDYGRTLAQVYLHDGTWVNGEMVRSGMAHVYTFTPNLRWAGELIRLESPAREARLGIWNTDRFAMLDADRVTDGQLGQFRVIRGQVKRLSRNGYAFRLGRRLNISIPHKYRPYFPAPLELKPGEDVVVHGVVRASSSGLYVALHSPFDLEKLSP